MWENGRAVPRFPGNLELLCRVNRGNSVNNFFSPAIPLVALPRYTATSALVTTKEIRWLGLVDCEKILEILTRLKVGGATSSVIFQRKAKALWILFILRTWYYITGRYISVTAEVIFTYATKVCEVYVSNRASKNKSF